MNIEAPTQSKNLLVALLLSEGLWIAAKEEVENDLELLQ